MSRSKEVKVGLLVVIAGTLLYLGFNFLKGRDFFSSGKTFYAQYKNIAGLKKSNPVIVNGLAVGRVEFIEILHDKDDSIKVTFSVASGLPVNDMSVAELVTTGVLGDKAINLILNQGKNVLDNDMRVNSAIEASILSDLQQKALPMANNVDSIIVGVKDFIRGNDEEDFKRMMVSVSSILKSTNQTIAAMNSLIAKNEDNVSETSENVKLATSELNKSMKLLEPILKNVNGITDSIGALELSKTLDAANNSLNKVSELMASVNQETGSIGKLINSSEMHENLTTTIRDIDYLVTDMQANPKRYIQFSVIGGTPKDERAIIKNFNEKLSPGAQMTINLKREAYNTTSVILYKEDRSTVELRPSGIGTKQLTFNLPSEFKQGLYLAKLDWDIDSEAFNFEVQ